MSCYVRNTWYVAAWSPDLNGMQPLAMKILSERLVLYRTGSGRVTALEDRCIHRLAPLSLGCIEGDRLRCMYHGILYDESGQAVEIPGQERIPAQARVKSYPVVERYGAIWVWMGDPGKADDGLIPPLVAWGHPDYILGSGQLDYAAQAGLINDNLLDFSHIAYVHANSFGLGSEMAETHAKITPLELGIRYERWMENQTKNAASRDDAPVDTYMTYDFLVPGIFSMQVASFEPGTARRIGYGVPNIDEAIRDVLISSQAVTPTGSKAARYFFCQGIHRRFGNEAMIGAMMAVLEKAFGEDKVMIEAQQRVIDDTLEPRVMPTTHDRSVVMFNRLVESLASAEAAGGVSV